MSDDKTNCAEAENLNPNFYAALEKQHITPTFECAKQLSKYNIVIGPNGSGKTRFLCAVKEFLETLENVDVLYGYFPDLSSSGRGIRSSTPSFSLREFTQKNNVSFNDFFKEIESQHKSFLNRLLDPESQNAQEENAPLLTAICESFEHLTGKQIYRYTPPKGAGAKREPKPVLWVRGKGSDDMSLTEALRLFSPGERMLFYMALFFALKRTPGGDRGQIIILDEPEAHLHPDALIKFVSKLKTDFPQATIMIATHSLFLLPQFEFGNIIYMENGQVVHRDSTLYDRILKGMLGNGRKETERFFSSLPEWQYAEFISECFRNPEVVSMVNKDDPQVQIFISALQAQAFKKVLDFGGGSGRLGKSALAAMGPEKWGEITYHIYDKTPSDDTTGLHIIENLSDADADYDCVVMMNVLHEIPPDEWPDLFSTLFAKMELGSRSILLFVEVEALRTGEYPHAEGYFLLGPKEMKELFVLGKTPDGFFIGKHRGFIIKSSALLRVSHESVIAAIRKLKERTYEEIKEIRNKRQEIDAPTSRKYAFLLQQYLNAKIYLDEHHC